MRPQSVVVRSGRVDYCRSREGAVGAFCKFSKCRLFRLGGAEVRRRNAGRIGGFEEGEFEADGATKEVATQICLSRPNAVQLRAQKINEPRKLRLSCSVIHSA
jgi:hypothetical protein